MDAAFEKQLAALSMYERAILMYCLHTYFNSGNYTTQFPLGDLLPDFAGMFDANPKINVFTKLNELEMMIDAKPVKVFKAMTYVKPSRQLVMTLNEQADLKALLAAVDN